MEDPLPLEEDEDDDGLNRGALNTGEDNRFSFTPRLLKVNPLGFFNDLEDIIGHLPVAVVVVLELSSESFGFSVFDLRFDDTQSPEPSLLSLLAERCR